MARIFCNPTNYDTLGIALREHIKVYNEPRADKYRIIAAVYYANKDFVYIIADGEDENAVIAVADDALVNRETCGKLQHNHVLFIINVGKDRYITVNVTVCVKDKLSSDAFTELDHAVDAALDEFDLLEEIVFKDYRENDTLNKVVEAVRELGIKDFKLVEFSRYDGDLGKVVYYRDGDPVVRASLSDDFLICKISSTTLLWNNNCGVFDFITGNGERARMVLDLYPYDASLGEQIDAITSMIP